MPLSRLASEGIVSLSVTLPRCVCVRRAAYITYRLHAALISAVFPDVAAPMIDDPKLFMQLLLK